MKFCFYFKMLVPETDIMIENRKDMINKDWMDPVQYSIFGNMYQYRKNPYNDELLTYASGIKEDCRKCVSETCVRYSSETYVMFGSSDYDSLVECLQNCANCTLKTETGKIDNQYNEVAASIKDNIYQLASESKERGASNGEPWEYDLSMSGVKVE